MRGVGAMAKILLVAALAVTLVGCSAEQPDPFGAIHIVAGPHSDLIVARGQYHLRADFPITPFAYGPSMYVPIDSVQAQAVLRFDDFDGVTTTIDSLDPGAYSLLVYVSRLSVNQVTPDTNVIDGDTVITDPTDAMGPYDYYFRPIFIDGIRSPPTRPRWSISPTNWNRGRPCEADRRWRLAGRAGPVPGVGGGDGAEVGLSPVLVRQGAGHPSTPLRVTDLSS